MSSSVIERSHLSIKAGCCCCFIFLITTNRGISFEQDVFCRYVTVPNRRSRLVVVVVVVLSFCLITTIRAINFEQDVFRRSLTVPNRRSRLVVHPQSVHICPPDHCPRLFKPSSPLFSSDDLQHDYRYSVI